MTPLQGYAVVVHCYSARIYQLEDVVEYEVRAALRH